VFDLSLLGWNPFFSQQLLDPSLEPGRVVSELGPRFLVRTAQDTVLTGLAGRHEGTRPVTGDWVLLARRGDSAPIVKTLARSSELSRSSAGRREETQALAANVDVVFVVQGLDADFNPRRLERYLAMVWAGGAQPVVLLNKLDLTDRLEEQLALTETSAPGVPIETLSALSGEGIDRLRLYLGRGRTGVFVGSSGAGKSTLLNALLGEQAQPTREVRAHDSRGQHTTTRRELFSLDDGSCLIDSPGLRELKLLDDEEGLERAFQDIADLAEECRFRDCTHDEEPGCAVRVAVEEGRLPAERLESYHKLQAELQRAKARHDVTARLAQKRKEKAFGRLVKQFKRDRGR